MSNTKNGIDVSEWQKEIDWEKVKPQIDFAIIRLGLGQTQADAFARQNISECNRLGIPYGLYWFSYAYNVDRAANEAKRALALMEEYGAKPAFGVWFDWEYDSRNNAAKQGIPVSNDLLRTMAATFCDAVRPAGYEAGIYANADYAKNCYGEAFIGTYPLWYAYLAEEPGRDVRLHQYSWSGKIDGISGNVDLDTWYEPVEVKKTLEEIAREVIAGLWGNGAERKRRLTEAGYNPSEVQDKVNALLGVSASANCKDVDTTPDLTAVAKDVLRGKYGNGSARKARLKAEGYTDAQITEIQRLVNQLLT